MSKYRYAINMGIVFRFTSKQWEWFKEYIRSGNDVYDALNACGAVDLGPAPNVTDIKDAEHLP